MPFTPELGQMCWAPEGSSHDNQVDDKIENALRAFFDRLGLDCYGRPENANAVYPLDENDPRATIATPVFRVRPFDWSESEDPRAAINFQYDGKIGAGSIKLSWYKYLGRSMSSDRAIGTLEIHSILDECLASLSNGWTPGCKTFPQKGVLVSSISTQTRSSQPMAHVTIEDAGQRVDYVCFDEPMIAFLGSMPKGTSLAFWARSPNPKKKHTGSMKPILSSGEPLTETNWKP